MKLKIEGREGEREGEFHSRQVAGQSNLEEVVNYCFTLPNWLISLTYCGPLGPTFFFFFLLGQVFGLHHISLVSYKIRSFSAKFNASFKIYIYII